MATVSEISTTLENKGSETEADENSDAENSDDGLQIVVESPRLKRKPKLTLDESDKQIIACVEKDLENTLEEKAAKANLNAKHVKNILKHVVMNEHVLALVRQVEHPDEEDELVAPFEPKYTRAKSKQLLSTHPVVLPWGAPQKTPSEVHVLFDEELQEDSSGDEYVPERHEESEIAEDTFNSSVATTVDDEQDNVAANIALRTRSKLDLGHTALEEIEGAFMPPDITTDMYDMNCDDDVWKDFLKTFTRPLDEFKAAEDEEQDPEYNILADEEIDEVDKEELRADRAVTVSRKELNNLIVELFEYTDIYELNKQRDVNRSESNSGDNDNPKSVSGAEIDDDPNIIKRPQIPILAQQMRQHVQMLAQNFLLTYQHPELSEHAYKIKDQLLSLKSGIGDKEDSMFNTVNLMPAINLVEEWEKTMCSDSKEVQETRAHVVKVVSDSIRARMVGRHYVPTFPKLVMETISKSEVFLYPSLLPRIAFKSIHAFRSRHHFYLDSEEHLLAIYWEQLTNQLKDDPAHLTKNKLLNISHICHYIQSHVMTWSSVDKLKRHVRARKHPDSEDNPIKYYFRYKKAPPTIHYMWPFDPKSILPPCKRSRESLPYLWRQYIYPEEEERSRKPVKQVITLTPLTVSPITRVSRPPAYNSNFVKGYSKFKPILPKFSIGPVNNVKINIPKRKRRSAGMLPDMPSLGGTPIKNPPQATNTEEPVTSTTQEPELSFHNASSNFNIQYFISVPGSSSANDNNLTVIHNESKGGEKDNPDDINELMIASATVKNVPKKEPSGAEKKRAKLRREFMANLSMAAPDDPETELQKEENFAENYFAKLRDTLNTEDYEKLLEILANYDQSAGKFIDLYKDVQSVLLPKYGDLSDEFLLFLTDIQAHKVGQLMPHFMMKDMARFIKKIQMYFKDQPSQIKKIIKCLVDLSETKNVTIEMIKSNILPLLKGNAALTDWFLQIFPQEKPPKILSTGPYEVVNVTKDITGPPEEEIYETIVVPDSEDPYGGPSCNCTCHGMESPQFKSKTLHCMKCSLKFIHGKVYFQTGKALRPGVVSFLTNPEKDHTVRLSAAQRKRSDTSPAKNVSGSSKEHAAHHDEVRNSNEISDEDGDGNKKRSNRPLKKQRRRKNTETGKNIKTKSAAKEKNSEKLKREKVKRVPKRAPRKRTQKKSESEAKPGSTPGQQKRPAEEPIEPESTEPVESVEFKIGSEHSGESESELFESSQDLTDSDNSSVSPLSPVLPTDSSETTTWTREEDKIILQAFRQRSDNEETFKHISEALENRSLLEIKNRFHKLMNLLQMMTSRS